MVIAGEQIADIILDDRKCDVMKFEIKFDQSPKYVYIQTDGEASVSGLDRLLKDLVNAPEWKPGTMQLVDHRKLKLDKFTSNEMQAVKEIVKANSDKLGNGKCAFVVSNTLGFGLARMYELSGGREVHQEIAVFYKIEEAIEWLNA